MKCPRCEHENETGAKFCEECAAPLAGCGKTRHLAPGLVAKSITMRATLGKEARMRGDGIGPRPHMWSYVPLERVPAEHPLRPLRAMVDVVSPRRTSHGRDPDVPRPPRPHPRSG